jgi:hypothetical protein
VEHFCGTKVIGMLFVLMPNIKSNSFRNAQLTRNLLESVVQFQSVAQAHTEGSSEQGQSYESGTRAPAYKRAQLIPGPSRCVHNRTDTDLSML